MMVTAYNNLGPNNANVAYPTAEYGMVTGGLRMSNNNTVGGGNTG
jgi:hypothetical protein